MSKAEYFPQVVDFETTNTRKEFQGSVPSCTAFGVTSAIESILDRAGQSVQLSPRFVYWWELHSGSTFLSVESAIAAINLMGVCEDSLCPYAVQNEFPYNVLDLDIAPDFAAIIDAQSRNLKGFAVQRIAGKEDVMRALCNGSPLVTVRTLGSGSEHCECCIGYDSDKGLKILGSGNNIYFEPFDSLKNGAITQVFKFVQSPIQLSPHPEYSAGDLATWTGSELILPYADVTQPYPDPWFSVSDAVLKFTEFGQIDIDPDCNYWKPRWNTTRKTLTIPNLVFNGQIVKNVRLTNPSFQVVELHEYKEST